MRRRVSSRSIVGREAELLALARLLTDAAEGRPGVIVLSGEAGIGKSRLAGELEDRARELGFAVLHGESVELGGDRFPYAPIADALRDLPPGWAAEAMSGAVDEARAALAALLPELARAHAQPPDGPAVHGRRCMLLLDLLGRLATDQPVLVVLEDLHWADRSSRDVVAHLARALRSERLALALTVRTGELPARDPLRRLLAELERRPIATSLRLAALTPAEVAQQLEAIAGLPVAASLPSELHARAGGNPFLVEELFAAQQAGEGVPATLAEATLIRVDALDARAQRVLALLAVAGGRLGHDTLERMVPVADAGPALRALIDAGLVVRDRDDRGVALRHGLTGEVLYAHLLPGERATLHRALATALAAARNPPAAQLAEHWHAAGALPEALAASITAALEARELAAYAEAVAHLERALELWDVVRPEPGSLPVDRAGLLARAAEAARFSGDSARAIALGRAAIAEIDASADPARAARLLERLGEAHFWDDAAALELYDAALAVLPPGASAERARLLAAQGHALMGLRRWRDARERSEAALAMADAADAHEADADALTTLGLVLGFLGEPEAGEQRLRLALEHARKGSSPDAVARAYINLGELLRLRGDHAGALRAMTDGTAFAARAGLDGSFGRFMAVNGADDLLRLGRWAEARERLRGAEGVPLGLTSEALRRATLAQLSALTGELEAAGAHLDRGLAVADGLPSEFVAPIRTAAVTLAVVAGDPAAAREHVEAGLEAASVRDPLYTPPLLTAGLRAEADLATLARARRRPAEAEEAVARAERLVAELDAIAAEFAGGSRDALAHRALGRAELARARGETDPGPWAEAAAAFDALTEPHPAAYARLRGAEALLAAAGTRAAARDQLAGVLRTAEALGAVPLRDEAVALATRARLDVDSALGPPAGADAELPAGLTSREAEVLGLVAAGLTNRAIGRELFITEKTVGTHIGHIFEKLDVHTRMEAAARAQLLGLARRTR